MHSINRCLGVAFGVGTQLLFLHTVARLFVFLHGGHAAAPRGPMWVDLLLALQFVVPHSLLLWPPVRSRLRQWVPGEFLGCVHCLVACLSLLLVFHEWRSSGCVVWDLRGGARYTMQAAFLLAWSALVYSLWISGLGRQNGWTTWYAWFRRRSPPPPQFQPKGWYRWFRHPIYLSFLGLIWLTPHMTFDQAVLTTLWTAYIFIGSRLKDARLEFYIGAAYREYESRVPGYPFMFAGPLGRRSN